MKTHSKGHFIVKGILFGVIAAIALTFATLLLWNWLMPLLFGLKLITFWQALGLLVLSKIIFGGGRHCGHFQRYNREKYWKERFKEKIDFAKAHHTSCHKPSVEE